MEHREWTSRLLRGHQGEVRHLAVSSENERIASAGQDGAVCIWEADTGRLLRVFPDHRLPGRDNPLGGVAFAGARQVVSLGGDAVKLWNCDTCQAPRTISIPNPSYRPHGLAMRPDGKQFAFVDNDRIFLAEIATGNITHTWEESSVQNLVDDPAGRRLAAAYQYDLHGEFKVFEVAIARILLHQRVEPEATSLFTTGWGVLAVAFSPEGRRLVAGGNLGPARVFDADSGKLRLELAGHSHAIMDAAFSPDGARIATASYDRTVKR